MVGRRAERSQDRATVGRGGLTERSHRSGPFGRVQLGCGARATPPGSERGATPARHGEDDGSPKTADTSRFRSTQLPGPVITRVGGKPVDKVVAPGSMGRPGWGGCGAGRRGRRRGTPGRPGRRDDLIDGFSPVYNGCCGRVSLWVAWPCSGWPGVIHGASSPLRR